MKLTHLAVAAALLPLPAPAEDPVLTRVVAYKVKPGMESKFEEGLKRHNDYHRKLNDPKGHGTCVVTSGPDTGTYLRFASNRNWKDFDTEALGQKGDQADTAVNVDPYLESTTVSYYRFRPELSRPREGNAPMYSINFYRLKFGKSDDFLRALRKSNEAAAKANWAAPYAWFSLVNGGEFPTYVLSLPRDKFADMNPPEKTFTQMLEETMGREEAAANGELFAQSVASASSQMMSCPPDLSYVPARK